MSADGGQHGRGLLAVAPPPPVPRKAVRIHVGRKLIRGSQPHSRSQQRRAARLLLSRVRVLRQRGTPLAEMGAEASKPDLPAATEPEKEKKGKKGKKEKKVKCLACCYGGADAAA